MPFGMKPKRKDFKMFVIGITGGIASGKSEIESLLSKMGFPVIDGDKVNYKLLEKNKAGYKAVVKSFGKEILDSTKQLDKAKIREIVFNNPKSLKKLEKILHPLIKKEVEKEIKLFSKHFKFLIYSNPIMFEGKFDYICDKVITIKAPLKERITRIKKRNGFTQAEANKIIKSQMSDALRSKKSDITINNNGTIKELKIKTIKALEKIL